MAEETHYQKVSRKGHDHWFFFWDGESILMINYLPRGQLVNEEYHSDLLRQLKDELKEKQWGKLHKGVLFLLDNAPACKTHKMLDVWRLWGLRALIVPPCSSNLAPSIFHSTTLKGENFWMIWRWQQQQYFNDQISPFFFFLLEELMKFKKWCGKRVELIRYSFLVRPITFQHFLLHKLNLSLHFSISLWINSTIL